MSTIMTIVTNLSKATNLTEAVSASEGNKDLYLAWGKEAGHTVKELNEAWKAAQPKKAAAATGFAAQYYDWLAEESRTEKEAHDYIMADDNSKNVKAHLTHYLNIWALAETVRSGSKVIRSVQGKAAKKSNIAVDKGEAPVATDPASAQAKEYRRVIMAIAKGEYKTVTVVRNQLKVLHDDELSTAAQNILCALQEFADTKGVKIDEIKAKAVELLNKQ